MKIGVHRDSFTERSIGSPRSLLSKERAQKFDLLLHLISNLSKPIIMCGPDGIGKSYMLSEINVARMDSWVICLLKGSGDSSFEWILEKLRETVATPSNPCLGEDTFIRLLKRMKERHAVLVLLLDDAGALKPGILKSLREFAKYHSALRLVLSMRPDHLHVQATTDFEIEDCHVVDLPPLTEQQCGEFLKNLASDPLRRVSFKSINPTFINRVYKNTHGIPGEIAQTIPKFLKHDSAFGGHRFNFVYLPVAAAVVLSVGIFWWTGMFQGLDVSVAGKTPVAGTDIQEDHSAAVSTVKAKPSEMEMAATVDLPEADKIGFPDEDVTDVVNLEPKKTENAEQSAVIVEAEKKEAFDRDVEHTEQAAFTMPPTTKSEAAKLAEEIQDLAAAPAGDGVELTGTDKPEYFFSGVRGRNWLLEQSPERWTLQVIVLSRLESLNSLVKNHADLDLWSSFETKSRGKTLYYLFYGNFSTVDQAKKEARKLPSTFRNAWPREFKSVQADIRSSSEN